MTPADDYREFALSLKGERCEICGSTEDIVVHHADGDRSNNELENLIPVCRKHHAKIHCGHDDVSEYVERLPKELIRETARDTGSGRSTITINSDVLGVMSEFKRDAESWNDFMWRVASHFENDPDANLDAGKDAESISNEIAEKTVDKLIQRLAESK